MRIDLVVRRLSVNLVRAISKERKGETPDCRGSKKTWRRGSQDNESRQHSSGVLRLMIEEKLGSIREGR